MAKYSDESLQLEVFSCINNDSPSTVRVMACKNFISECNSRDLICDGTWVVKSDPNFKAKKTMTTMRLEREIRERAAAEELFKEKEVSIYELTGKKRDGKTSAQMRRDREQQLIQEARDRLRKNSKRKKTSS